MHIGKSSKEYEIIDENNKKRIQAGSKGVGRFALSRLGYRVCLKSKKIDSVGVIWKTDWNTSVLDESYDIHTKGTDIEIIGLREKWNKKRIENLNKYLERTYHDTSMEIRIISDNYDEIVVEHFPKAEVGINCRSNIVLKYNQGILVTSVESDEFENEALKYCPGIDIKKYETKTDIVNELKGNKITESTKTELTGSEKAKLIPTDVGMVVNDFLKEYFPQIMDYNFTASVERQFDEIAEGDKKWTDVMEHFYEGFHPLVEDTMAAKSEHKVGERMLGVDPVSGKPVSVKIGRYGPVVQIGTADDEEKPRFAQLKKEYSLETITLEEALDLFKLPRTLGELDGVVVTVGTGRFGPYVRYNNTFVSIPKDMDPMSVTLEDAETLIREKQDAAAKKVIKTFDADSDMQILNGRYGPYISYQKKNYKIPDSVEAADLTLDACFKVIELQKEKAEVRKVRGGVKKK